MLRDGGRALSLASGGHTISAMTGGAEAAVTEHEEPHHDGASAMTESSPRPAAPYGDFQLEIYLAGLGGTVPTLPVSFAELEARAAHALPPSVLSYVAGGAGDEQTQRANVAAFSQWGLMPRMLVGAVSRDMSVDLFGLRLPSPAFLAPIGVIGLCAQDGHGDLATAEAAARLTVPMVASTLSADPMEDVARRLGAAPGFFQLYTPTDRELAQSLVARAERAGFRAIVVTLDTWITGWRPRDLSTSNFPQLRGLCLANYTSDPVFRTRLAQAPEENPMAAVAHWAGIFGNPLTWDDLPWLRSLTKLPLILKGICHPDDARRALDAGADGIYVSNHGGRQANGGLPALDCLPGVVEAAAGRPVLFDSGVRSGADIIKALALGATAVGIGRPYAYGLALAGTRGIEHVLRTLLAEADLIMAVDGYPTLADLTPDALRRVAAGR
jgi:lactate 2-monooxygenase